MSGVVLLQGGNEFSAGCREMDGALLARADGPVVVTALAGAVGREYATATAHGVRHFRALGADVVGAPDVREDEAGALAALRRARLLVLPGGSPSRLLGLLQSTPVGAVVADLLAAGGVVSGSSAGAMVLGSWTVLPEQPGPGVVPALGHVPGVVVVPHWRGSRDDWVQAVSAAVPAGTTVLGLAEESGVLVEGAVLTAVGQRPTRLLGSNQDLPVGQSWRTA